MGRKHRRIPLEPKQVGPAWPGRTIESHPDGDWTVQRVTGASATKRYRCPGCDQEIPMATPHVVAWPAEDPTGLENRRHWHTACWAARDRRRPRR